MQYYIDVGHEKRNTAGAKAPEDISKLCEKNGMKCFPMPQLPLEKGTLYQKMWILFVCTFYWCKLWKTVGKDDVVLFQHPMYGNRISAYFIPKIKKQTGCRFIALIHDLESLRQGIKGVFEQNDKTSEISDNVLLKQFDVIICHNDHMKQYLVSQGFEADKLVCLGIFDYLCDCEGKKHSKGKNPSIAIAGNLAPGKCTYIYDILNVSNINNSNLTVHLYGNNYDESKSSGKMIYHGSYLPEELPQYLEGDFGLVWDGVSIETCAGNTGEYLKYNNPHKASLYLASGMPIIVWKQSAIADFILEHEVGIAVDDLDNLGEIISHISNDEYRAMCENADQVGKKIRSGEYFTCALKRSIKKLNSQS